MIGKDRYMKIMERKHVDDTHQATSMFEMNEWRLMFPEKVVISG